MGYIFTLGLLVATTVSMTLIYRTFRLPTGPANRLRETLTCLAIPIAPACVLLMLLQFGSTNDETLVLSVLLLFCTVLITLFGIALTLFRYATGGKGSRLGNELVCGSAVGITLILAILPAIQQAREATERSQCRNNLKQINLSLHNLADSNQGRLPLAINSEKGAEVSWRVEILPYLDGSPLIQKYHRDREWNSLENRPVSSLHLWAFVCPAATSQRKGPAPEFGLTDYAVLVGKTTLFPPGEQISLNNVTDGLSNTIMAVEAVGRGIHWAEPKDIYLPFAELVIRSADADRNQLNPLISSAHLGGGHVLLGDESVKFLSSKIDPKVLEALTTANGGESLPETY